MRLGDREVVVGAADLDVVEVAERVGGDTALLGWEVGEHRHAGTGVGARVTERQLDRRRQVGRRVERPQRFEPVLQGGAVGGPAQHDVRPLGGGEHHGLGAGPERARERAGPPARLIETRGAVVLARLHARRHVEHQHQRRATRLSGDALDVGPHVAGDQRQQERELKQEERVGEEAAALERMCRHLAPEKQCGDADHALAAVVEIERHQHRDRRQRQRAGGIEYAEAAHRRRTRPSRASSPVTNALTSASLTRRA